MWPPRRWTHALAGHARQAYDEGASPSEETSSMPEALRMRAITPLTPAMLDILRPMPLSAFSVSPANQAAPRE